MAQRVAIRLGAVRTVVKESAAVKLRPEEHGADLHMTSRVRICRICTQNEARYTCPKCNAAYCSVVCYKTHSESCTEQFYEAHVRSEMALTQKSKDSGDAADERQMQELLERAKQFQEQATAGDAQAMALAARLELLAKMDESELSLDCLTHEERAQFLSEVADGRLSQFVALWQPWWLRDPHQYEQETAALRRQGALIEEIGFSSDDEQEDKEEQDVSELLTIKSRTLPVALFTAELAERMPPDLKSLLPPGSAGPSPLLRVHLMEILFSYAMIMRTFNGDWQQDVEDAALTLLHLCQVLGQDAKFDSMAHVLHACKLKRVDNSVATTKTVGTVESHRLALSDAQALLTSRTFVLDALIDLRQLVASYRQELLARSSDESAQRRAPTTSKTVAKQHKRTTRAAARRMDGVERKLWFYLVWAFFCDPLELSAIAAQIVAT